jgi:dTDP-4-dehydrorhamnose 3,5-epimerase-like enzyme
MASAQVTIAVEEGIGYCGHYIGLPVHEVNRNVSWEERVVWEERVRGLAGEGEVTRQCYTTSGRIDGTVVVHLARVFPDPENGGSIREIARLDGAVHRELASAGFVLELKQINVTIVQPGCAVGLHVHPDQREAWFVLPGRGRLTAFMVDFRPHSPTRNTMSRVVLGYQDTLLGIPQGVLHGYHNPTRQEAILIYLTSHHFEADPASPGFQEGRVAPADLPLEIASHLPPNMKP